jgi:hypothetical protein
VKGDRRLFPCEQPSSHVARKLLRERVPGVGHHHEGDPSPDLARGDSTRPRSRAAVACRPAMILSGAEPERAARPSGGTPQPASTQPPAASNKTLTINATPTIKCASSHNSRFCGSAAVRARPKCVRICHVQRLLVVDDEGDHRVVVLRTPMCLQLCAIGTSARCSVQDT